MDGWRAAEYIPHCYSSMTLRVYGTSLIRHRETSWSPYRLWLGLQTAEAIASSANWAETKEPEGIFPKVTRTQQCCTRTDVNCYHTGSLTIFTLCALGSASGGAFQCFFGLLLNITGSFLDSLLPIDVPEIPSWIDHISNALF